MSSFASSWAHYLFSGYRGAPGSGRGPTHRTVDKKSAIKRYFRLNPSADDLKLRVKRETQRILIQGEFTKTFGMDSDPADIDMFENKLYRTIRRNLLHKAGRPDDQTDDDDGDDSRVELEDEDDFFEHLQKGLKEDHAMNAIMIVFTDLFIKELVANTPVEETQPVNPPTDHSRGGEKEERVEPDLNSDDDSESWLFGSSDWVDMAGAAGRVAGGIVDSATTIQAGASIVWGVVTSVEFLFQFGSIAFTSAFAAAYTIRGGGDARAVGHTLAKVAMYQGGSHIIGLTIQAVDERARVSEGKEYWSTFKWGVAGAGGYISTYDNIKDTIKDVVVVIDPGQDYLTRLHSTMRLIYDWSVAPMITGKWQMSVEYNEDDLFTYQGFMRNQMMRLCFDTWSIFSLRADMKFITEGGLERFTRSVLFMDWLGEFSHLDGSDMKKVPFENQWLNRDEIDFMEEVDPRTPVIMRKLISGGEKQYFTNTLSGQVGWSMLDSSPSTGMVETARLLKDVGDVGRLPGGGRTIKRLLKPTSDVWKYIYKEPTDGLGEAAKSTTVHNSDIPADRQKLWDESDKIDEEIERLLESGKTYEELEDLLAEQKRILSAITDMIKGIVPPPKPYPTMPPKTLIDPSNDVVGIALASVANNDNDVFDLKKSPKLGDVDDAFDDQVVSTSAAVLSHRSKVNDIIVTTSDVNAKRLELIIANEIEQDNKNKKPIEPEDDTKDEEDQQEKKQEEKEEEEDKKEESRGGEGRGKTKWADKGEAYARALAVWIDGTYGRGAESVGGSIVEAIQNINRANKLIGVNAKLSIDVATGAMIETAKLAKKAGYSSAEWLGLTPDQLSKYITDRAESEVASMFVSETINHNFRLQLPTDVGGGVTTYAAFKFATGTNPFVTATAIESSSLLETEYSLDPLRAAILPHVRGGFHSVKRAYKSTSTALSRIASAIDNPIGDPDPDLARRTRSRAISDKINSVARKVGDAVDRGSKILNIPDPDTARRETTRAITERRKVVQDAKQQTKQRVAVISKQRLKSREANNQALANQQAIAIQRFVEGAKQVYSIALQETLEKQRYAAAELHRQQDKAGYQPTFIAHSGNQLALYIDQHTQSQSLILSSLTEQLLRDESRALVTIANQPELNIGSSAVALYDDGSGVVDMQDDSDAKALVLYEAKEDNSKAMVLYNPDNDDGGVPEKINYVVAPPDAAEDKSKSLVLYEPPEPDESKSVVLYEGETEEERKAREAAEKKAWDDQEEINKKKRDADDGVDPPYRNPYKSKNFLQFPRKRKREDYIETERDRILSLRGFLPTAGTSIFDEQDEPLTNELKMRNLEMGMTPHDPLGVMDNRIALSNYIQDGFRYSNLDPVTTNQYFTGGSMCDGDRLYGTKRDVLLS